MNALEDAGLRAMFDDRPERLERKVVDRAMELYRCDSGTALKARD